LKAFIALVNVCSGDDSNGLPSLSKNEQSMQSVGISSKGLIKAVAKRGKTYKSLLEAAIKLKREEPSTRSPLVRIVSKYSRECNMKLRVFNLPSPAGYMKFNISMPSLSTT
jgi:hypothetical protein